MPAENELKYVLPLNTLRDIFEDAGWKRIPIKQAYLPDGPRIRQYGDDKFVFTYKRWIEPKNRITEIELDIDKEDFNDLWLECKKPITKTRYLAPDSPEGYEWSVDFLETKKGNTYFVLAEVEMPEGLEQPPEIHPLIASLDFYAAAKKDTAFTNKKLSNKSHAKRMYRRIEAEKAGQIQPEI